MFVHLHVHSYYSLLEALPAPAELAQAAASGGMPAVALTDRRSLAGVVEFHDACKTVGVQPIFGLEVDYRAAGGLSLDPLTLLATGREGWSNLCQLVSALNLRPEPDAPCPLDLLAAHAGGLLALCGHLGDPLGRALRQIAEVFPNCLYVELPPKSPDVHILAGLAKKLHLPALASQPIFALQQGQLSLLCTLAAIRLQRPMTDLPPGSVPGLPFAFAGVEEMRNAFTDQPDALRVTLEVAERCRFDLPLHEAHYPQVPLPPGVSAAELLRQKADAGARRLYGQITPEIRNRLDGELEVIAQRGFEPIFLIVEEVLQYAHANGVPVSSRGSAASSLVAHCLGITSPDPLRLNLYFERFLNPARATPPDIDTDLCSRRRDGVLKHIFDTYGADRVAMVGTINRFRSRSALGEVAKAHGLPQEEVRALVNTLPYHFFHGSEEGGDESGRPSPYAELKQVHAHPRYQVMFEQAETLLRQPRHLSVHPGGVIIASEALAGLVPLQRSGTKGVVITQLDLHSVEQLGLVKLDMLGIRGLTVLGDVADAVHSWRRSEYRTALEVLENIPLEDDATAGRMERGDTIGCFQVESPGMRATLREIRARKVDDIMAALALYRPGPLQGGLRDAFVRRFKGEEAVEHLHPALVPLLEESYGVILYQEQVLRIAHELAGLSLAEADLLRRAMSHFDPGKQMQLLQEKFIAGAAQKSRVPHETAARVWEMMAAFAGYGFPKAHAASYALVAWRSAWCKQHFPAEFMAAVLANWGGYYSQGVYITEARRLGLKVNPPHVNHSQREFCVSYQQDEPALYMGLDQVRDLTGRTQERILHLRPFTSLDDFLARVDPRPQEAQNLVRAGAFTGLGNVPVLLERLRHGGWKPGQMPLFAPQTVDGEWELTSLVAAQQEVLGISLAAHPLELHADRVKAEGALTTVEAVGRRGERVCVAGMRQTWHRTRTARGETMLFLTLEDLEGMLDAVVFPDVYTRVRGAFGSAQVPLLVSGVMEWDEARAEPLLRVEKVERLE